MEVLHTNRIKKVAKERNIEIGLITTPPSEAQNVTDMLVEAGVRGILNFAPTQITVPKGYVLKDIFFTTVLDPVIGIGDLGSSLLAYNDFLRQNYKIVAAFDVDPLKVIGRVSEKLGQPVEVLHTNRIKEVAKERKIEIGLITTPPQKLRM